MDVNDFLLSNGRSTTARSIDAAVKRRIACALPSCTEYSQTNAWNVNFSDGNVNNNNKYNSNAVRAVAALGEEVKKGWVEAFRECCRNKKSSHNCNLYRVNYELDLWRLVYQVYSRTYKPTTSICFMVTRPKLREVFAADFRDRIAHHWVCKRIEPLFETRFVAQGNVSHNCRPGFGTASAVAAMKADIERVTKAYTRKAWVGKFDLRSFFTSIDCDLLWDLLREFIVDNYKEDDKETLLYLAEVIIKHRPQADCMVESREELWDGLPAHKSLRGRTDNIGIAIGNLPSQLCANFIMSFFDEWMTELCKAENAGYQRFVDDFAVVAERKEFITELAPRISEFLRAKLHLNLHRDKVYIQHAGKGLKFVGQVIKPGRSYISNRTFAGLVSALQRIDRTCKTIAKSGATAEYLSRLRHQADSVNSYLGFTVHCACFKMRRRFVKRLSPELWGICYFKRGYTILKIRKQFQLTQFLTIKEINDYGMDLRRKPTLVYRDPKKSGTKPAQNQLLHPADRRNRRLQLPVAER